jgi:hypothetical protein
VEDLLDQLSSHVGSGHTVWFAQGVLAADELVYVVRRHLADGYPLTMLPAVLRELLARLSLEPTGNRGLQPALEVALERLR